MLINLYGIQNFIYRICFGKNNMQDDTFSALHYLNVFSPSDYDVCLTTMHVTFPTINASHCHCLSSFHYHTPTRTICMQM